MIVSFKKVNQAFLHSNVDDGFELQQLSLDFFPE